MALSISSALAAQVNASYAKPASGPSSRTPAETTGKAAQTSGQVNRLAGPATIISLSPAGRQAASTSIKNDGIQVRRVPLDDTDHSPGIRKAGAAGQVEDARFDIEINAAGRGRREAPLSGRAQVLPPKPPGSIVDIRI